MGAGVNEETIRSDFGRDRDQTPQDHGEGVYLLGCGIALVRVPHQLLGEVLRRGIIRDCVREHGLYLAHLLDRTFVQVPD